MKLNIAGKDYELVYNMRTRVLFETIADKAFSLNKDKDWIMFAYAAMMAKHKDLSFSLDEFIDAMDIVRLMAVIKWGSKLIEVERQLLRPDKEGDLKKK